ncbi:hypothetical protein ACTXT7_003575 [Hymenolepis weldensis]
MSIQEMISGCVRTDPTEVQTVMRTKFPPILMVSGAGLRVNADADAYVETLQTIVKPCIDNVVNGRSSFLKQDLASPHKAHKT